MQYIIIKMAQCIWKLGQGGSARRACILSIEPEFMGAKNNVSCISSDHNVFGDKREIINELKVHRQKQKSAAVMSHFVNILSDCEDIVFDHFAGSYKTERVFVFLQIHRRGFISDHGTDCRLNVLQEAVVMFAKHVFNESSKTGSNEFKSAIDSYLNVAISVRVRET